MTATAETTPSAQAIVWRSTKNSGLALVPVAAPIMTSPMAVSSTPAISSSQSMWRAGANAPAQIRR